MNLKEIFDALSTGELSQLSVGGQPAGVIDETNAQLLLPPINLGLDALYRRFTLKQGRVSLQLVSGRREYPLHSKYAVSNARSREPVRWLLDTAGEPFADDLLKIERLLTEPGGEMALNDPASPYTATTPSLTTLRLPLEVVNQVWGLPEELKTSTLEVVYRAAHTPVVLKSALVYEPERVQLQLPATYKEALLLYVASRVHAPSGAGQTEGMAGNSWYSRFLSACQDLENEGLEIETGTSNTRFVSRGFV